ncbi:unnamed protein product, partial [Meganyctiphanes norvegica]
APKYPKKRASKPAKELRSERSKSRSKKSDSDSQVQAEEAGGHITDVVNARQLRAEARTLARDSLVYERESDNVDNSLESNRQFLIMAEDAPEHHAARAASESWLLSLANFREVFDLLEAQLTQEVVDWKMSETVAILKHWCGTLTVQRDDMTTKASACPPSEAKTNLNIHINDNYKYEVNLKARTSVAERFMERRRQNNREINEAPAGERDRNRSGDSYLTRLSLDNFTGDLTKYEEWQRNTKSLIANITDENIKVRRIRDCLSGQAKLYAGDTGVHLLTENAMWEFLDKRYKDQWAGNLEIGNRMLNLFRNPITTINDLVTIEDKLYNIYLKAVQRGYSMEQLVTTLFLAALPDPVSIEIVREVKTERPHQHIFTWADLGNHPFSIIQNLSKHHELSDPLDLLIFNNCTMIKTKQGENRNNNHWKNFKHRERNLCTFCSRAHKTSLCIEYPTIDKRKKRLKELHVELCYSCLTVHDKPCKTFDKQTVCDNFMGRCCGGFLHRRYLCPEIGIQ